MGAHAFAFILCALMPSLASTCRHVAIAPITGSCCRRRYPPARNSAARSMIYLPTCFSAAASIRRLMIACRLYAARRVNIERTIAAAEVALRGLFYSEAAPGCGSLPAG